MSKITDSARGEECQISLSAVCSRDSNQTVWAHSNKLEHGKGMGLKAKDEYGCYACYYCHMIYDRQMKRPDWMTLQYVEDCFYEGMLRSREILKNKGLL